MSNKILDVLEKDSLVIDEGIYSPGFHFLTTVLLIIIFSQILMGNYFITLIPIALIVVLQTTREVIEVDFNNRKYRDGFKFLGKVYREWERIPDIKYVSIIGRDIKAKGGNIFPWVTPNMLLGRTYSNFETYEIRLFYNIRNRINLVQVSNYNEALAIAKKIAQKLDEKLLDATQNPPKFVEI